MIFIRDNGLKPFSYDYFQCTMLNFLNFWMLNWCLIFECKILAFPRALSRHIFPRCMGGPNIAAHTLKGTKKCHLKRGKTYLFDTMNLLYSMCSLCSIADLLAQQPAVPTRQLVSFKCLLGFFQCLFVFFNHRYLRTSTNGSIATASAATARKLSQCISSLSSTGW